MDYAGLSAVIITADTAPGPAESHRHRKGSFSDVKMPGKCLKLLGHLLTDFHGSLLGTERTTNHSKKTYTLESKNQWGEVFLFLQRKQMQVSEERNALSDVLTFDYSNKKHIRGIRGTAKKPNLQLGRGQYLFPQEVQSVYFGALLL